MNLLQIHWTTGDEGQGAFQPEVSSQLSPRDNRQHFLLMIIISISQKYF